MKNIRIVNKADRGEIYISGTIIDDFTADVMKSWDIEHGYTFPQQIKEALAELKDKPIDVYLDSNGGLVSAGMSIAAMLKRHAQKTVAHIDTWAASIASVIALACDSVEMPAGTYLMIHRPLCTVEGNVDTLNEAIGFLNKITDGMLDIYGNVANDGVTRESILEAMTNETWLNPSEAAAMFKNVKVTDAKFVAAAEACVWDSAPDEVKAKMTKEKETAEALEHAKAAIEAVKELGL